MTDHGDWEREPPAPSAEDRDRITRQALWTAMQQDMITCLMELDEAGALEGIRAVIAERVRRVRYGPPEGVNGLAYQAADLAEQIEREAAG